VTDPLPRRLLTNDGGKSHIAIAREISQGLERRSGTADHRCGCNADSCDRSRAASDTLYRKPSAVAIQCRRAETYCELGIPTLVTTTQVAKTCTKLSDQVLYTRTVPIFCDVDDAPRAIRLVVSGDWPPIAELREVRQQMISAAISRSTRELFSISGWSRPSRRTPRSKKWWKRH